MAIAGAAFVLATGCTSSVEKANRTATTSERPRVVQYDVPRTPEDTVLLLRRLVRAHSFPTAVDLYDPRIIAVLGRDNLVGLLGALAPTVDGIQVMVIEKQPIDAGFDLTLRGNLQGKPISLSYVLLRQGRRWKILYDSMINDALAAYIQTQTQRRLHSGGRKTARRAAAAGTAAVLKYQRAVMMRGAALPRR